MSRYVVRRSSTALRALLIAAALTLIVGAPNALAVQSDVYDEFSGCPTEHPWLNGPPAEFALCVSGTVPEGSIDLGSIALPVESLHLQLAATGGPNPELEDCGPINCLPVAPGTTQLEGAPSFISLHDAAAHSWGRVSGWRRGHGKGHRRWGHKRSRGFKHRVKATIEPAGDVKQLAIDFLFGAPVPALILPIKVHLESWFLGRRCYVGSESAPIVLAPLAVSAPSGLSVLPDPNGFPIELVKVTDFDLADASYAVPAASGCGRSKGRHGERAGSLDRLVDRLLGLPSASGSNQATLLGTDLAFAAAAVGGPGPSGGALLQAAFDAAR